MMGLDSGVTTDRMLGPEELSTPQLPQAVADYATAEGARSLKTGGSAGTRGNPLLEPPAYLAAADMPAAPGEALLAARIVAGEDVQRYAGQRDCGTVHAAAASSLGPHASVRLGGAYLLTLWVCGPSSPPGGGDGGGGPVVPPGGPPPTALSRARSVRSQRGGEFADAVAAKQPPRLKSAVLPDFKLRAQ